MASTNLSYQAFHDSLKVNDIIRCRWINIFSMETTGAIKPRMDPVNGGFAKGAITEGYKLIIRKIHPYTLECIDFLSRPVYLNIKDVWLEGERVVAYAKRET